MILIWIVSLLLAGDRLMGPGDLSPPPAAEGEPAVINSRTPGPVDEAAPAEPWRETDAGTRSVTVREPLGQAEPDDRADGFGVVGDDDGEPATATEYSLQQLFDAMREQESGGLPHGGRDAVGDDGNALGPYQIWRPYWQDAAEADDELGGGYENVRSAAYSEKVMRAYWSRYCPQALADPTRLEHLEVLARVHNGGPRGAVKAGTLEYWEKIRRRLER
jgi:hypothetical protein